jgi:hypothetical protein
MADLKAENSNKDKNLESFKGQAQSQNSLMAGHLEKLRISYSRRQIYVLHSIRQTDNFKIN